MANIIVNNAKKETPRPLITEGCAVRITGHCYDDWNYVVSLSGSFYLMSLECGRYFNSKGIGYSGRDHDTSDKLYTLIEQYGYKVAAVARPEDITVTINLKD